MNCFDREDAELRVLVNDEDQYSLLSLIHISG